MDIRSKLVNNFTNRAVVSVASGAKTVSETFYFHVIMPVSSDPYAASKRALIKQVAACHGIRARFPDYPSHSPVFDLDIFTQELKSAGFILVDLSGERPSCYYELGIAEALGCQVVLIANTGTPIHQSAHRQDVLYYANFSELSDILTYVFANLRNE